MMKKEINDIEESETPPAPKVEKKSGPSIVWLIPLITALIGGWLIVKTISEKGPEINITFKTAEGIEAGKTKIKYKDIEIGVVKSASFNKDFSRVILTAEMAKEAAGFLKRDTQFWVVKPRLSLRGASGLSTLVSGAYIEIEPGQGDPQKQFVGLDVPPVIKADVAGKKIILMSRKLGSIDTGSPVYYQGILAGEVLGYELANDQKSVYIHAFIRAPYDQLVQSNTRFWNTSGMDVSVSADGVRVRTESIQSLLFGGIAFDTPDTLEQIKDDVEGLIFTLHDNLKSIEEQSFTKKISFILFFDGSVRGLNIGAPVEFKGIKIGSVVDIRLEFNTANSSFRIPVLIEIEPERVVEKDNVEIASPYETLKKLVDHGLRAQLQTGNLLTGQLFVDLDMHPGTPIKLVNAGGVYPELPTISGGLEQIKTSVQAILDKLEHVELDEIGKELQQSLHGFNNIMSQLDSRVAPLAENVEKAMGSGHQALEKLQMTLDRVNETLTPGSPLIQMTDEMAETARSIRIFMDMLERNPDSIVFGKKPSGEEKK